MKSELVELILNFLKAYGEHRCAPYDWSFKEQESYKKLIAYLEQTEKGT